MARKCMQVKVGGAGKRAALKDQKPGGDKKRASKKSVKAKEGNGNGADK